MEKIIISTFTDPMMGLSYEQEPVYEKLADYFGDQLVFKYVMSGLVRDVSDFMLPQELALPAEEGILVYNKRLAGIYKSEESIGGLPINMDGFHLFDSKHRSSYPLCIAYKAVQLCDPGKADMFLMRLRRATIVHTRQTTKIEELVRVARDVNIPESEFLKVFEDGRAEKAFHEDLHFTASLGIRSLPACLIQYKEKAVLVSGMMKYEGFISAIEGLQGMAARDR